MQARRDPVARRTQCALFGPGWLPDLGDQDIAQHDLRQPARELHDVVATQSAAFFIDTNAYQHCRNAMVMSASGPPSRR